MTEVVEGEVVEDDVVRRRERNAARTPEVLPPDVDTKVVALSRLDSPELQARAVTTMLNHARTGLLAAIAAQDLPQIAAFKQKAAAIQEIAKQVRLGKDMQLDAAEFVRRAERGLGVAIREGQQKGDVETPDEARARGAAIREVNAGRCPGTVLEHPKPKPTDFASGKEFSGARGDGGIYAMTDGVSEEAFEESLAEAKEEGNLSRANVARKCKSKAEADEFLRINKSKPGPTKEAIDADDPLIDAPVDPPPSKAAHQFKKNSTEMVDTINHMLQGAVQTLAYADPKDVDPKQAGRLRTEISTSLNSIRRFLKEMPQ